MFGNLFGKKGPVLKKMESRHFRQAIEIIAQTDEDDAAEAEESLREREASGMYVLEENGKVLGLTGALPADVNGDVAWLSWTYLHEDFHGTGKGRFMVDEMLGILSGSGVRKIFIATSDYTEDGEEIYAAAHKLYESFGAEVEMRIPHYHDVDETKIVYGMVNPNSDLPTSEDDSTAMGVHFSELSKAPEAAGGYALGWEISDAGVTGLDECLKKARDEGARIVFASLPSDLSGLAGDKLKDSGFEHCGELQDYHNIGLSDVWWSLNLQ